MLRGSARFMTLITTGHMLMKVRKFRKSHVTDSHPNLDKSQISPRYGSSIQQLLELRNLLCRILTLHLHGYGDHLHGNGDRNACGCRDHAAPRGTSSVLGFANQLDTRFWVVDQHGHLCIGYALFNIATEVGQRMAHRESEDDVLGWTARGGPYILVVHAHAGDICKENVATAPVRRAAHYLLWLVE